MVKNYGKFLVILITGMYSYTASSAEDSHLFTTNNKILSFLKSSFVATLSVGYCLGKGGK